MLSIEAGKETCVRPVQSSKRILGTFFTLSPKVTVDNEVQSLNGEEYPSMFTFTAFQCTVAKFLELPNALLPTYFICSGTVTSVRPVL